MKHRGKRGWMIGVMGATFLLLALALGSFAAEDDIINAAPYLRTGAGARPLAMGGASTAVADDATATVWNINREYRYLWYSMDKRWC